MMSSVHKQAVRSPLASDYPRSTSLSTGRNECGARAVAAQLATLDYAMMCLIELGDERAMAQIYETHSRMVYAIALRILKDPCAAEDVVQDVFLKIWRKPSGFSPTGASLGAWLGKNARNRAIDLLRTRKPGDCCDDVPLRARNDVAKEVEQNLMMDHARRLIDTLPDRQRQAIGLSFMEGLSHAEIAKTLHSPLGSIKTNIRMALQQLSNSMRREVVM
jgi:RNA polymerase sigma-70 factor (ECF subfamily)